MDTTKRRLGGNVFANQTTHQSNPNPPQDASLDMAEQRRVEEQLKKQQQGERIFASFTNLLKDTAPPFEKTPDQIAEEKTILKAILANFESKDSALLALRATLLLRDEVSNLKYTLNKLIEAHNKMDAFLQDKFKE